MTAQEAKQRLERIWKAYTSAYDIISEDDVTAFDMAISALQAQKSKTKENCDTCKHDPPSKKWPCVDCDMRTPADMWEAQDVPDIHVGKTDFKPETVTNCHDLISKRDAYLALVEKGQASRRYKLGETWELNGKEIREALDALPSAQPDHIGEVTEMVGDTISRQAAIDALMDEFKRVPTTAIRAKNRIERLPSAQPERCEDCENFGKTRLLIPQPEKRTETHACDLISRQAAFDIINVYAEPIQGYIGTPNDSEVYAYARGLLLSIERNIRALPSAQPEIIHCEHCKHGVHSGRGDTYLCTVSPEELGEHKGDFYCGYSERRADE